MRVAVGSDLVAAFMRLPDQMRISFRDVAEEKTCHPNIFFREDIEQLSEITLDAGRQRIPLRNVWSRWKIQYVKPIFDIH